MPDDPLIDQMEFAVAAGAGNRAGIKHFIARLKQRHFRADLADNACGIPAKDFRLFCESSGAHLGIDRIHGYRANFDQQIPWARCGRRETDVNQCLWIVDGQGVFGKGDGFHGHSLSEGLMHSLATIFDFPCTEKNKQNAPTLSLLE
ncbi:hypothetical protein FQZ97_991110 [compost metagenome]